MSPWDNDEPGENGMDYRANDFVGLITAVLIMAWFIFIVYENVK
jgi:hypothetical protein